MRAPCYAPDRVLVTEEGRDGRVRLEVRRSSPTSSPSARWRGSHSEVVHLYSPVHACSRDKVWCVLVKVEVEHLCAGMGSEGQLGRREVRLLSRR